MGLWFRVQASGDLGFRVEGGLGFAVHAQGWV